MKRSRFLAFFVAGALTLSFLSCSDNNTDVPRQSRVRDKEKEFAIGQSYAETDFSFSSDVDIDDVSEGVNRLLEDIEKKDNSAAVSDDISELLRLYDELYEANTYKEIEFYTHYSDEATEKEYNEVYRQLYVAGDLIDYGFVQGYISDYADLFKDLVTAETVTLYEDAGYDIEAAIEESEASFDDLAENRGKYYDIIDDDSLSEKEKDIECAKILIELLKEYDTDTLYSQYDRDYTGEEILALGDVIKKELIPVSDVLLDEYLDKIDWTSYFSGTEGCDEPFEVVRQYAGQLSPDIQKSADRICDEHLYKICSNDDAFEGAFTDELPLQDSALIFMGSLSSDQRLSTAIHEFGHFHATFYDDTPTYLSKNNIDIAEIQSQGLELLYTQFYDDIYGNNGDFKRLENAIDLLDSVISGYLVGEFEYTSVRDINTITPEEMVDRFNGLFDEYFDSFHLYMISHLFESPGYYISYSTSALASFDLIDDVTEAPDKALEKYEKMAKISCNSGEYTFREALSACGFSDVLTADYIRQLATYLRDYADKL